jgi:hypothetical protein
MAVQPTYPGVYVEEVAGGARTIPGVSTSTTVFIGWAPRGPVERAQRVGSFREFEEHCGGIDARSLLGYSVKHFFDNGGSDAHVVRVVAGNAATAAVTLDSRLRLTARSPGAWANAYTVEVRAQAGSPGRFALVLRHCPTGNPAVEVERFENLALALGDARAADVVINAQSALVTAERVGSAAVPPADTPTGSPLPLTGGQDGDVLVPGTAEFARRFPAGGAGGVFDRLDALDAFNLLVVPGETTPGVVATLQAYCRKRRAFCIIDCAATATVDSVRAQAAAASAGPGPMNSALFFPWITALDPLAGGQPRNFPPGGFVAGIYARTDSARGVWKAPAGTEAGVRGATGLAVVLRDDENGVLNPLAVNCLRRFPAPGIVVWGSRTLDGTDARASEWKYVPVRRTALYIEESLVRGTQWAVFEPNGEPLWAQLRLNVGAFMNHLFRQGAFQGQTPRDAFFVKCDRETTTQSDILNGIANVWVGFAPLKPAEFVVIKIALKVGQAAP